MIPVTLTVSQPMVLRCLIPSVVFIGLALVSLLAFELLVSLSGGNAIFWALFYGTLMCFVGAPVLHSLAAVKLCIGYPERKAVVCALTFLGYLMYLPFGVVAMVPLLQAGFS